MIDQQDRKILNLLQADARLSNAQIAEALGLSTSSCWRKIRALEEAGVIEHYSVALDPTQIGLKFEAIVHLQLDRHDSQGVSDLSKLLEARPEVVDCFATTGSADYHMRVLCTDIEAYNRFLDEVLFQNTSVKSAQTNVVLRSLKRGNKIAV